MLTENDMQDISRLIELLKKVIEYVVENEGSDSLCKGLLKSLRILEGNQRNGFKNLYNHIMLLNLSFNDQMRKSTGSANDKSRSRLVAVAT